MMGATVELMRRNGMRTIVLVTPTPLHLLKREGLFDPERDAARMALLREIVESRGGRFLDLHDALKAKQFSDVNGHFTADGDIAMAARTAPPILREVVAAGLASNR